MVDTPDFFFSESPPAEVQRQISLCISLAAPGPHAFLLCVQPQNELDLQTLDALELVFGSESVKKHTMVLFTHTDMLSGGLTLQEYLKSEREDLKELLARCEGRYHVVKCLPETQEEEKDVPKSVMELLEKVEEMVKSSGTEFYTCPPPLHSGSKEKGVEASEVQNLSAQILKRRNDGQDEVSAIEDNDEQPESTDNLEQEEDFSIGPPDPPQTFFHWIWDTIVGLVLWLPTQIRGTSLLGSIVGLFFGGAMGATVGTVATEVERRKHKTKTK